MIIQANPIGFIIIQFAFLLYIPIPKIAPMSIWVELTGIPNCVAKSITMLAPSSAENPVVGRMVASFEPTVVITSLPKNQSPTTRATPNIAKAAKGTGEVALIVPFFKTSKIAAKGPIALAISLAPCENAKLEAVNI